jgi:hypothetical protein
MKKPCLLILVLIIPLLGFSQEESTEPQENQEEADTTAPAFVKTWRLVEDFTTIQDFHFDTLQTNFQIFHPVYRNSISNAYLGNLGLQSHNNLYFNDDRQPGFFFLRPYIPYLYTPEKTTYYNITKPFTMLEYYTTFGGEKEEREEVFHAIHSQNINPYLNLGLDLRLISSGGKYNNQKGKVTNFMFFGSYTGMDYSLHSSFLYNGLNAQENGGLKNDSIFRSTDLDGNTYEVNLEDADSRTRGITYHLTQRYRFGKQEELVDTTSETGFRRLRSATSKTGSLIHSVRFDRNYRNYIDPGSGASTDFYPGYFIDDSKTFDSTFYRSLTNTFQLMLDENPNRKNDFGARVFVSHEWVRYAHNTAPDSIFGATDTTVSEFAAYQYGNVHIGASALHTVGTGWSWIFTGKFYPLGYKAGDLILSGEITKMFYGSKGESRIQISGRMSTEEPDHFLRHYESNHFQWENDFRKLKDIRGSLLISNEAFSFEARANISLVSGYIYFNEQAVPAQYNPVISIIGFDVSKKFKLGPFNSSHQAYYYLNTNKNVVRIPDLSYYTSEYFAFPLVRDVLTLETGFDLYYYTKYRGLAFSPSSGAFYAQETRELGNYPNLNLFLTAKLKRTRFYLRWDHAYAGLIEKNYFHVLNYPIPGRIFRFGLSWTFYD